MYCACAVCEGVWVRRYVPVHRCRGIIRTMEFQWFTTDFLSPKYIRGVGGGGRRGGGRGRKEDEEGKEWGGWRGQGEENMGEEGE